MNVIETDELSRKYEEFLRIPNVQVKFDVDESITPSRMFLYRVPLALEDSVNKRLKEMKQRGIIEMAPDTPKWISPMKIVMKGKADYRPVYNHVIDMRRPNKALRRAHYPFRTLSQYHETLKD